MSFMLSLPANQMIPSSSDYSTHHDITFYAAEPMQSCSECFQLGSGNHQSIYDMAMSFWERLTNKLLPMLGAMQQQSVSLQRDLTSLLLVHQAE